MTAALVYRSCLTVFFIAFLAFSVCVASNKKPRPAWVAVLGCVSFFAIIGSAMVIIITAIWTIP